MYGYGEAGKEIPLCLDCSLKHTQMLAIQNDQLERQMNYATEQMEAIVGLPGILPHYPQRKVNIIQGATVALNNINVTNSNVGVLNTGNLEIVDSAITQLNQDADAAGVSNAISQLANAIVASNELSSEKRNEAIEILGVIASEATAPKDKRRGAVIKSLLPTLGTIIQSGAGLIQIWQAVLPVITTFFGF
jgi:hypothetical protein